MNQNQFETEFARFTRGETITLELSPAQAWMLLRAVQLAARHPQAAQSLEIVGSCALMRDMQEQLDLSPELEQAAQSGWETPSKQK